MEKLFNNYFAVNNLFYIFKFYKSVYGFFRNFKNKERRQRGFNSILI